MAANTIKVMRSALAARSPLLNFAARRAMATSVGDSLPSVNVFEDTPGNSFSITDVFAGKKGILFGVPGAFTPGCSKTHLPGYVAKFDELKGKGIEVVACMSVNDPFVMAAWGEAHAAKDKVRMLADSDGSLSKAMGVDLPDAAAVLGNARCKRFSMLIEDNVVKAINVEPDNTGLSCSLVEPILASL